MSGSLCPGLVLDAMRVGNRFLGRSSILRGFTPAETLESRSLQQYQGVILLYKLLPMPNGHSEAGGAQDNFHLLGGATTHIPHFDLNSVILKKVDLLVLFLGLCAAYFLSYACSVCLIFL